MKIINLTETSKLYTCNVYYVTGTWKTLGDTNTLIDAGMDPKVIPLIQEMYTGVGKRKVDQVILTHNHHDHAGMVRTIRQEFQPLVLAFSSNHEGIDRTVRDGEQLRIGDRLFEVISMPGHSTDSILLYNQEEGVLFAGDSPIDIKTAEGQYEEDFIKVLERLTRLNIQAIYFGHGQPMMAGCREMIRRSYQMAIAEYG